MWMQTNDGYLDRHGCGDELSLDADLKASSVLAALQSSERLHAIDELDDADDAAAH